MLPPQFVAKWKRADLSERSAYQQHFLDLCDLLGQPKPADADPAGEWYVFERGVNKDAGGKGFADVWRRGFFGWEYKGKKKNLADAYRQLSQYREALANPPLLIVCDLNRFEIHTNFPNTVKEVHAFDLDGLADPKNLDKLRAAFTDPDRLRPGRTQKQVTEEVAGRFARLADGMWGRGVPTQAAAHFLMKLMFCMFAEDIDLLPHDLFLDTVTAAKRDPARLSHMLADLFAKMAAGGYFGRDEIAHFNGGLFADADVIELTPAEIEHLVRAAECDWSQVEPSIFGTLFERTLDPAKRSQIGAHYTGREDIETLLEPVMMAPLRREWDAVRAKADKLWVKAKGAKGGTKPRRDFEKCVGDFLFRLAHVTVLDPACGSGNFLYVAINLLLSLEKEVITYANAHDMAVLIPGVRPMQLRGIEINPTAQQLAQVVIWIGFLQWMKFNGFVESRDPVLDPMETIEHRDAILDLSDPANPTEPDWPDAEFIVGNPPFLGNKLMRSKLGAEYVEALWSMYGDRLPAMSDLCCYWFEKARAMIEASRAKRAGLLATTGIKQVGGRRALERIAETGRIFFAESDREWTLEGAAVRIAMVGYESASGKAPPVLNSKPVQRINADLTGGSDVAAATPLAANAKLCFMGTTKVGAFDIELSEAVPMLSDPNPHGKPNSDVLRPWVNGSDIVRNPSHRWIIDFGVTTREADAMLYTTPFGHLEREVKPGRQTNGRESYRAKWWIHGEPRPAFRAAVARYHRYIGTARVAKHRLFVWLDTVVVPDSKVIAIAYDDDFHFGVLHSRIHEVWSLKFGSKHGGERPTYNPDTCFLPFPFPEPTAAQRDAIAAAAKDLDALRANWLNPPEWTRTETLEFPGSVDGPWRRYVTAPDARGVGTVRYPRLVPKGEASAVQLKKRTLTNLYNERPAWLANAHRRLDEAVFAAYGWPADPSDDDLLARLLALNLSRAGDAALPTVADDADE
jgi:hypothetical protein